jgi:serine/threonine protein kinase
MEGKSISHYTIFERLGAGGIGEVYRAHDNKLDRDVAIKILPEQRAELRVVLDWFEELKRLMPSKK